MCGFCVLQNGEMEACYRTILRFKAVQWSHTGEWLFFVRSPEGIADASVLLNVTRASGYSHAHFHTLSLTNLFLCLALGIAQRRCWGRPSSSFVTTKMFEILRKKCLSGDACKSKMVSSVKLCNYTTFFLYFRKRILLLIYCYCRSEIMIQISLKICFLQSTKWFLDFWYYENVLFCIFKGIIIYIWKKL